MQLLSHNILSKIMSWMLVWIWTLVVVICDGENALRCRSPDIVCTDGFLSIEHSCFKLVNASKTWDEAKTYCDNTFNGLHGRIAVVENYNVYAGLTALLDKHGADFAWIGARDVNNNRRYQWVNGKSCCPDWWVPSQPSGNGRCLEFWRTNGLIGLDDRGCDTRPAHFLCETNECTPFKIGCPSISNCQKHKCLSTNNSVCHECMKEYTPLDNGTVCASLATVHKKHFDNYGYITIFYETQTWNNAENICSTRVGHLYVPSNTDVDYKVRNYFKDVNPIATDVMFWIGGHLLKPNQIQWKNNQTVNSPRWSNTTEALKEDKCIAMDPRNDYKLRAVNCTTRLNFICQESILYVAFG